LPGIDWAWLAMDGVMTKAILGEKQAGKHPTDRGKTGTKRSVLTDGWGVPIGLAVDGVNRNDFKMVQETIESLDVERSDPTPDTPQGRISYYSTTTLGVTRTPFRRMPARGSVFRPSPGLPPTIARSIAPAHGVKTARQAGRRRAPQG